MFRLQESFFYPVRVLCLAYKKGLFGLGAGVMDAVKAGTLVIQGLLSTTADFSCRNGFGAAANRSLLLSDGWSCEGNGAGPDGEVPNGLVG